MGSAIPVKRRLGAADLRKRACTSQDTDQARRLWPWLRLWTGRAAGLRRGSGEWIVRPCAIGCMPTTRKGRMVSSTRPRGRPPKLTKAQKEKPRPISVADPDPVKNGVPRWRCVDLKRVIKERFGVDLGEIRSVSGAF